MAMPALIYINFTTGYGGVIISNSPEKLSLIFIGIHENNDAVSSSRRESGNITI